jgi:hypothetical protein
MPFVVRASVPAGQVRWLTLPKHNGLRTFALRPSAEVFATKVGASRAIGEMTQGEDCTGIAFSAELAE